MVTEVWRMPSAISKVCLQTHLPFLSVSSADSTIPIDLCRKLFVTNAVGSMAWPLCPTKAMPQCCVLIFIICTPRRAMLPPRAVVCFYWPIRAAFPGISECYPVRFAEMKATVIMSFHDDDGDEKHFKLALRAFSMSRGRCMSNVTSYHALLANQHHTDR